MKSQEDRIRDGAAAYKALIHEFPKSYSNEDIVRRILDAADRESPKWPSDESVRLAMGQGPGYDVTEGERQTVRAAFEADPIIKAAVEWATLHGNNRRHCLSNAGGALVYAVNEAGL